MTLTGASRRIAGGSGPMSRTPTTGRPARGSAAASMIALQHSAGNTSTVALLRRARSVADEAPATLTLTGVVDHVAVSSWSLDSDTRGKTAGLEITRLTDADSPVLAKAVSGGTPDVEGRLIVRRLTPLGWIRQLTLTMADCMADEYTVHDNYESIRLSFSAVRFEQ
jgi:hypothetical protein